MEETKKKMSEKKKKKQEAGWATAHLPVLGHDTGNCIVTQGWEGWPGRSQGATIWLGLGHYTAEHAPQYGRPASRASGVRAHGLAVRDGVVIQMGVS